MYKSKAKVDSEVTITSLSLIDSKQLYHRIGKVASKLSKHYTVSINGISIICKRTDFVTTNIPDIKISNN